MVTRLPFRLIPYLLRTVDVGVRATFLAIAALLALILLPTDLDFNPTVFWILIATTIVGVLVIRALPWERLFAGEAGMWMLYAWSALDIVLISAFVWMTGGENSPLFVLYALTTVFFAASYPVGAQVGLLLFTWTCFLIAGSFAPASPDLASAVTRMGLIGVVAFIAAFLSRELLASEETLHELEEAQARQRQAVEINDNIVQGLVVAKYSLSSGDRKKAEEAIDDTLDAASRLISDLMTERKAQPGDFVRSTPADMETTPQD